MDLRFLNRPFLRGMLLLLIGSILSRSYAATPIRGPDVTIIAAEEELIYEFRQNGRLTMIKVVPKWGKPYYLIPEDPTTFDGNLIGSGALVPSWRLRESED